MALLPIEYAVLAVVLVGIVFLGIFWCYAYEVFELWEPAISYAFGAGGILMYLYTHSPIVFEGSLDRSLFFFVASILVQLVAMTYSFFGSIRNGDIGVLLALCLYLSLDLWGLVYTTIDWINKGHPKQPAVTVAFIAATILWGGFCFFWELYRGGRRWSEAHKR